MAQTRLVYSLFGDNKVLNITPTLVSGTPEDASYGVGNLSALNPAKPMRLNEFTCRVQWDMVTPTQIDWIAIIAQNLDPGLAGVKIEGNATAIWTSPTLSQAITIPGIDADNYHINAWKDLTAIGSRTFRYWSFAVTVANSAKIHIGQIGLIGTIRALAANINWPVNTEDSHPIVERQTNYGVTYVYDSGVRLRRLSAPIDNTDANAATVRQWWLETRGRARPFYVVPDPAVNDVWLVRFQEPKQANQQTVNDRNSGTLAFEELSRGIVA